MRLSPDTALLRWTTLWLGLAILSVPLVALRLLLPFWQHLREYRQVAGAMVGVNAAVVGLLLAAFYDPVFTAGVGSFGDLVLAGVGFALLAGLRWPAWSVVLMGAVVGLLRGALGQ